MHPSATRLYEAARQLRQTIGQSNVARLLGETPQTVKNWEARGISDGGAIKAEGVIGCRAYWLSTGEGNMLDTASPSPKSGHSYERPRTGGSEAQNVSPINPMIAPTSIRWESIVSTQLPPLFQTTIQDDAMGLDYPRGCTVNFSTTDLPARSRDLVLLTDADGTLYFREYQGGRGGQWQAVALVSGFPPLDSQADGLRVLAVSLGRWGRRG